MPIFFQQQINEKARLGIWKIEETEEFFRNNVPLHRDVTHPHKRLQHLAGRFLLQFLVPGFPYELIQIADTRKPYLKDEQYHFSISHCGDYAAAIVSSENRVGVDIELIQNKIARIADKFLSAEERAIFKLPDHDDEKNLDMLTLCWSAKESVFKWYGEGKVEFRQHIQLTKNRIDKQIIECYFTRENTQLEISYRQLDKLNLAWVIS